MNVKENIQKVRIAARQLTALSDAHFQAILHQVADAIDENTPQLLIENAKDLARMDSTDPKYDRLLLNQNRIKSITDDMRKVADLESPLHRILEEKTTANGLFFQKISVALGVIGVVYESRPNVTLDVFSICLKSGNAVVLKGSQDAYDSNFFIVGIIKKVLQQFDLQDIIYLLPAEREHLIHLLEAVNDVDCIIPRGSQKLIDYVRQHSKVPVIETGAGVVHTYIDQFADLEKAKNIITNAKARRVSVCNALDCLVVHQNRLNDLPFLLEKLIQQHDCTFFADKKSFKILEKTSLNVFLATDNDFGKEHLSMALSIKTVKDDIEAVDFISTYSSKHSEAIVTENQGVMDFFTQNIDAAVVYVNASTAFTDGGEFGFGAEIGISTQKLHARGPMALREMTSYKWVVKGNGQVR